MPKYYRTNKFLRVVQRLSGFIHLKLTTKIGHQGLRYTQALPGRARPARDTGQTEEARNHYAGVEEHMLVKEFLRKSARRRVA